MASIALVALTILYDELGAHRGHWFVRNAVNAAGFTSFEIGAALVASKLPSPFYPPFRNSPIFVLSIWFNVHVLTLYVI